MIEVGKFSIRNCLLCDDIRQEKNNKLIILGVFSGDILIPKVPANISLAFFIDGFADVLGETSIWFKLSGPGEGHVIIEVSLDVTMAGQQIALSLPRADVTLECEGVLRFDASSDQKDWVNLMEKKVILSDEVWSLFPTVSERPFEQSQPASQGPDSQPEPSPPNSPKRRRRS